jgi:hypothetical protein
VLFEHLTPPPDQETPVASSTYKYKIVEQVDPCTLNTLGMDGWELLQYGTDSDGNSLAYLGGKDEACNTRQLYRSFTWAFFEQTTSNN